MGYFWSVLYIIVIFTGKRFEQSLSFSGFLMRDWKDLGLAFKTGGPALPARFMEVVIPYIPHARLYTLITKGASQKSLKPNLVKVFHFSADPLPLRSQIPSVLASFQDGGSRVQDI
jgi:hypothetical protein